MRLFIFAYDRYDTMTTANMCRQENVDHIVLCHSEEAKKAFIACDTASADTLVSTGQPKGLAYNRNAALELMEQDEWAIFLVDDLKTLTTVKDYETRTDGKLGINMDNQKEFGTSYFRQPLTMRDFIHYCHELKEVCESLNTRLGGFCGIDNPPFRDTKWKFNSLADGRAWIVKKGSLRFDLNCQANDDMSWTIQNINRYGTVPINNWILPDCRRWATGGMGTIEERMPTKISEAEYLVNKYPSRVAYAKKAGWPDNSHITIRRSLPNAIVKTLTKQAIETSNTWRQQNPLHK